MRSTTLSARCNLASPECPDARPIAAQLHRAPPPTAVPARVDEKPRTVGVPTLSHPSDPRAGQQLRRRAHDRAAQFRPGIQAGDGNDSVPSAPSTDLRPPHHLGEDGVEPPERPARRMPRGGDPSKDPVDQAAERTRAPQQQTPCGPGASRRRSAQDVTLGSGQRACTAGPSDEIGRRTPLVLRIGKVERVNRIREVEREVAPDEEINGTSFARHVSG